MSNFALGYSNTVVNGVGNVFSGGSWQTTAGLAYLSKRPVGQVARSTDATTGSTTFTYTYAVDTLLQAFGLAGHNMSLAATIRVRFFNAAATLLYDSTALAVWPAGYTAADLIGISPTYAHLASAAFATVRSVQVDIVDTANAAGYVQAGRLFLGLAWQGSRNMDYGASVAFEDPSTARTSIAGAKFFDVRPKYRVASWSNGQLAEAEAMGSAYEVLQHSGETEEVLFMWDPADTTYKGKRDFLGHFRALNPIKHAFVTTFSASFEVEEFL